MTTNDLRIAIVYGSAREGRFCDTVAGWLQEELTPRSDLRTVVVDPRDLDRPGGKAEVARGLDEADAFIVVTPEYNHGYPAALKHLIDDYSDEWQAKPVAFVSYGGISGGLRAVEQLRLVFAELHATTLRDGVSFANAHEQFDAGGRPRDGERARRSLHKMLAGLRWWAAVLRHGRWIAPYAERHDQQAA